MLTIIFIFNVIAFAKSTNFTRDVLFIYNVEAGELRNTWNYLAASYANH